MIGAWLVTLVVMALVAVGVRHLVLAQRAALSDRGEMEASGSEPGPDRVSTGAPAADGAGSVEPTSPPDARTSDPALPLLAEARALKSDGRLNEARAKLFEAHSAATDPEIRRQVEGLLGEIHTELVFAPYPMEEKVEYVVQPGDKLATIARRYGTTVELIQRGNRIANPARIRVGDRLRILTGTFTVRVSKSRNELEVYLNGRFFKRYRVGTGKYGTTPTGRSRIVSREFQPTWWRPDGTALPYGHPENVLGTHWLGLDIRGYGIHGTWEPDTIGRQESAGCVRLLNSDIEELYTLLPIGTEVVLEE